MGVLALNVGLGAPSSLVFCQSLLTNVFDTVVACIHRAGHVAPLAVAFIVGEPCVVKLFNGFHDRPEVITSTTLVATRPNDNGWVISK